MRRSLTTLMLATALVTGCASQPAAPAHSGEAAALTPAPAVVPTSIAIDVTPAPKAAPLPTPTPTQLLPDAATTLRIRGPYTLGPITPSVIAPVLDSLSKIPSGFVLGVGGRNVSQSGVVRGYVLAIALNATDADFEAFISGMGPDSVIDVDGTAVRSKRADNGASAGFWRMDQRVVSAGASSEADMRAIAAAVIAANSHPTPTATPAPLTPRPVTPAPVTPTRRPTPKPAATAVPVIASTDDGVKYKQTWTTRSYANTRCSGTDAVEKLGC